MPEAKNLLFDAQSLMNNIARKLNLSLELIEACNQYIYQYYTDMKEYYSNPPVVVASILYNVSKRSGEELSVNIITSACGVSVRWFERRRDKVLKNLTEL